MQRFLKNQKSNSVIRDKFPEELRAFAMTLQVFTLHLSRYIDLYLI